jgi:glutaredoxin
MYPKDGCGHCQTAKEKLTELNIKLTNYLEKLLEEAKDHTEESLKVLQEWYSLDELVVLQVTN